MKHLTIFVVFAMILLVVSGFSFSREKGRGGKNEAGVQGLNMPLESQNFKTVIGFSLPGAHQNGQRESGQGGRKNKEKKKQKNKEDSDETSESSEED